tara:strand:+ start:306 stop:1106 length:801 start_codon:yes stop_codon:yes gene_type:complete
MDTSLNPLIILFLFFIGSVFGSFLNVVIYRVPKKMSIVFPSSHCFNCKKNIPLKYNIPIVGYFLLKGKCINCSKSFPSRYAFVELITAILTIIIYLIFDISPLFFIYLVLTYLLIAVTFVDIDHFIIPNGFILFGLAVLILSLIFDILSIGWEYSVSGSFVFAGFLFFIGLIGQFILKKESIGFGDVKLGLILGGFLGVEYSILALYLSFALSAILIIAFYRTKINSGDTKIPFGPYLAAGTLISLFTIEPNGSNYILNWYYRTMF